MLSDYFQPRTAMDDVFASPKPTRQPIEVEDSFIWPDNQLGLLPATWHKKMFVSNLKP